MPKHQIDLDRSFSGALSAKAIPDLESKIARLEEQLALKNGEIDLPIEQIYPNPRQPRKSFYVVEAMRLNLQEEGQKTAIEVVSRAEGEYQIFDGECRWQGAKLLGWKTIKAVIKPYNPKTFDDDVLVAAIVKHSLNALDLSVALTERICLVAAETETLKVEKLTPQLICTKLNTTLVRLKRNRQHKQLGDLVKKSALEREQELEEMGLEEVERLIFQTILRYGLNPISVCKNQFPMLRLPEDVKQAIRERGLGDAQAKAIGKLSAEKLNVSQKKAEQIRQNLIEEVLAENLSSAAIGKKVEALTSQSSEAEKSSISRPVQDCLQAVKKLSYDRLNEKEKQELILTLQDTLAKLT